VIDYPDSNNSLLDIKTGGADEFHEFIEEVLKPTINAEFRTNPNDESLLGYSLGGLFAVYSLFNHPESYDRYIIGSPSLWFDDKVSFLYELAYFEQHSDMEKSVFISVGSLEEQDPPDEKKMVSNAIDFYEILSERKYSSLFLDFSILEGKTHGNAPFESFNLGIKSVFEQGRSVSN
jgi:predicted alpha/beta superfamily hydrolase